MNVTREYGDLYQTVVFTCVQGGNCAVIGVKAELGVPDPSSPNAGKLEFFVDW